jgi:hypothetical protein
MRAAGLPLEELPGAPPIPIDLAPEERVERAITMLQAGFIGEKVGPPSRDPQKVAMLFDVIGRSVDTSATPNGGATIQWDFRDADPWYLRIDNGATRTEKGRHDDPDLTFRCAFEDWVDITAGRQDARLAMLTGKLRPKGSVRLLMRMPRLFGR